MSKIEIASPFDIFFWRPWVIAWVKQVYSRGAMAYLAVKQYALGVAGLFGHIIKFLQKYQKTDDAIVFPTHKLPQNQVFSPFACIFVI